MSAARARGVAAMLALAAAVVAIDQVTKGAVRGALDLGERRDLVLGFDLTHVRNSGIAFGLLEDAGDSAVLAVAFGALSLVVVWFLLAGDSIVTRIGAGLLIGGAVGNLIDRLRIGGVTDFIDPPWWPAFNVADVAITLGIVVLALAALDRGAERTRRAGEP